MKSEFLKAISFLTSAEFQESIFWVKIAAFAISGFLLAVTIFLLLRTKWMRYFFLEDMVSFFTFKPYGMVRTMKRWEKIAKKLALGSEDEYKTAVLEADDILDEVLSRMGYLGDNLREKLDKVSPSIISNKNDVYQAHQVRNNIVYEPNFKLSLDQTQKTLDIFEQALKDLQAV